MFDNFIHAVYLFTRSIIKWFLHKYTRLCELQRIVYGCRAGSKRAKLVEKSLGLSKQPQIKNMIAVFDRLVESSFMGEIDYKHDVTDVAVNTVLDVKRINPKIHHRFPQNFGDTVDKIWGYKRLNYLVEELRSTAYDCNNLEHERKLLELWKLLMPDVELENRISKQWQDIGFQGDDPKTDFRGMGMLGLENLLHFAIEYPGACRQVLLHSLHPAWGYTFAIVGINLTAMATRLLKTNLAKTHFYNLSKKMLTIQHFHQFYIYLFYEFDKLWMKEKPKSIMDFSHIQEKFETNILCALDRDDCLFKINLVVENV